MSSKTYPPNSVRALLATDLVTPQTREVITARLESQSSEQPRFFDEEAFRALQAACARLIPQTHRAVPVDLAAALDQRLADGKCDGWRYASMPPDDQAYRRGLQGLDDFAQARFGTSFVMLEGEQQDAVLAAVQRGEFEGAAWDMPANRFFEELLAELSECYYSDPLTQEEIGYVGMADAQGWSKIGLNEREPWEPEQGSGVRRQASGEAKYKRLNHAPISASPPLPPMKSYSLDEPVDAVIIGTGAGGAPLLARLAMAGMRVVALEAGKHWTPAQDFATDERAQAKLFWNDERLSAGDDPIPFGNNNSGIGVGGSTLHYTAYVPRPQPDDLRLHTEFGVGMDWPLAYGDLAPYYDELERFLGVSGPASYPWGPARPAYPLAPLPLNGAAQLMQRGCAALGLETSPAPNAALSARYFQPGVGWRAACTNRGFCQAGCSTGAKASMDVTFIPLAVQAGAELRTESFVTQFERDDAGRVTGVVYVENGVEQRQRCRAVFVCAGAIETPRLLLLNDLANSSGHVGRNFMAHVGVQVWGQFAEDVRPYKGIPGALISEATHRPHDADFAGGYLVQSIGVMPITYASQLARGPGLWGTALHDHMRGYNHTAGINVLGECLPHAHNYLTLSDERDARGLFKPKVYFSYGENEHRMTAHATTLMRDIWERAGAHDTWVFPRSAHTIGTCRMGSDAASAVVDSDGRAFDVPNLYISDNSTFPSALSANPALTIMALSLRTADRFLERVRRMEA